MTAINDMISSDTPTLTQTADTPVSVIPAGKTGSTDDRAMAQISAETFPPIISLGDLANLPDVDPDEILKCRFLCRGSCLLLTAYSGIGKTVFAVQAAIMWALGTAFLGLRPSRALKILIINGEDDDHDLWEIKQGVIHHLQTTMQIPSNTIAEAMDNIRIITAFTHTSTNFGILLTHCIKEANPDLIIVNPILTFLGGDAMMQKDVSIFLRNVINPVIKELNVALILIHHANKPGKGGAANDYLTNAYNFAGSAEWINFSRATLTITPTSDPDIFKLIAAKRGSRLQWQKKEGGRTDQIYISHAKEFHHIYWRLATEDEIESIEQKKEKPRAKTAETVGKEVEIKQLKHSNPEFSNRQISGMVGCSPTTVGKVLKSVLPDESHG